MVSRFTYYYPYDGHYEDGTYRNRPAIEDHTPIIGGVSYGEHPDEAVVVNPEGSPALYQSWYMESIARASIKGVVRRGRVLQAVYDTIDANMAYDMDGVNSIVLARRGKKIDLSRFMQQGVGVCRHMALAAGMLLELHKHDGHIRGTPRVNRSERVDNVTGKQSGHAWTRYNTNSGKAIILDNAQHYLGALESSLTRLPTEGWDYRTPEDW